ncbi:hypothetical protein VP01_1474g1 [Puccinia sorghi]|uniref:Aquaporin n=1 Tax=Puccinia sorghi TaxID=27349 RepID=A0A0L6VK93_9BASI|nr:hypothetical protein VP01_1474g1 [Puccinia sorghi]
MAESSGSMDKFLIQTKRDLLASVTEYFGMRHPKYFVFSLLFTSLNFKLPGTTIFLLMGLGGIQAAAMSNQAAERASRNPSTNEVASVSQLMYIATRYASKYSTSYHRSIWANSLLFKMPNLPPPSMALALLASSWTFFRISGSVFNPNVAIALVMTGALKPLRFFLYVIAEILAGITASGILHAILPGTLSVGCSLGLGTKVWQGLLIEAILTAILSLTVLFRNSRRRKTSGHPIRSRGHRTGPLCYSLGWRCFHWCSCQYPTDNAPRFRSIQILISPFLQVNSARAFGPDVVSDIFWELMQPPLPLECVIPTILIRSCRLTNKFLLQFTGLGLRLVQSWPRCSISCYLKSVDYEVLNPKQDSDRGEDSPDLKGIEVKMRRRTTQFEKGNDHSYPASIAPKPMPPNFGLVSAPFHASTYRPEMPDSSGPVNPLAHEGSRPQSPIMKSVNGVPSTHGAMSTITSTKQTHPKGFPSIFSQIEHHENVDRIEVLSPLTDGYAHQTRRKSQYPTSSVC